MDLVRSWWLGWRPTGTGTTVVGPDGLALIGFLDGLWPWGSNLLWTLVVLAALPVGAVGVWRLTQPVGGGRSRAVAVLVYLSVPLPYDALRDGRLAPMAAFAVLPWVVRRLVGAQGVAPYGTRGGEAGPGTRLRGLWSEVLVTGLLLGAVAAVDPMLAVPVAMVLAGLVVGTILAGSLAGLGRLLLVTMAGVVVAGLLQLPLVLELLTGRSIGSLLNPVQWPVHGVGTMEMFRLDTGDFGLGRVGSALLVVPVLALVVARGRHLFIALRAWFVVAASWSAVWILNQGWWDGPTPEPGVLLAPAAVGLAWAAAVGVAGLGSDLLGEAAPVPVPGGAGGAGGAGAGVLVLLVLPVVAPARVLHPERTACLELPGRPERAGLLGHGSAGSDRQPSAWPGCPWPWPYCPCWVDPSTERGARRVTTCVQRCRSSTPDRWMVGRSTAAFPGCCGWATLRSSRRSESPSATTTWAAVTRVMVGPPGAPYRTAWPWRSPMGGPTSSTSGPWTGRRALPRSGRRCSMPWPVTPADSGPGWRRGEWVGWCWWSVPPPYPSRRVR